MPPLFLCAGLPVARFIPNISLSLRRRGLLKPEKAFATENTEFTEKNQKPTAFSSFNYPVLVA